MIMSCHLVRVESNRNCHLTGETLLTNNVVLSHKTKDVKTTSPSSHFTPRYASQRHSWMRSPADSSGNGHGSADCNSKQWETTQTSVNRRMWHIPPMRRYREAKLSHKAARIPTNTSECQSQKHARRNKLFRDIKTCGNAIRKRKEMSNKKLHPKKGCENATVEGFERFRWYSIFLRWW